MRILITGATDGLGRALAADLAGRGAGIVVHGRDRARAEAVSASIGAEGVLVADFASLADVGRMAGEAPQVDVLVNNAGVAVPERRLTEDGNELTFQVNHLAHFLLTLRLLPARIVNVASVGQHPTRRWCARRSGGRAARSPRASRRPRGWSSSTASAAATSTGCTSRAPTRRPTTAPPVSGCGSSRRR